MTALTEASPPLETTNLLLPNTKSIGHVESGEKVQSVELFADLTVAVALHCLSELEEFDGWFFLRVAFVWYLWHNAMIVINLANLYTNMKLTHWHYAVVFGSMIIFVLLVKACEQDDNRVAMSLFILGRCLLTGAFYLEAHSKRPEWIEPERHINIQRVAHKLLPIGCILEMIPLILCLLWPGKHGDDSHLLWGGIASFGIVMVWRSCVAYKYDRSPHYDQAEEKLMDMEHMQERYALIVLICLGELCFAAVSESSSGYYQSMSALFTAFGCFRVYFIARVEGRTEAWTWSAQSSMICQDLHLLLYCTIPSMGVAYVLMFHEEQQQSDVLLGLSSGVFLVIMGFLEMTTKDPEKPGEKPRMPLMYRVLIQIVMGAIVAWGGSVFHGAALLAFIPVTIILAAWLLCWGVQPTEVVLQPGQTCKR